VFQNDTGLDEFWSEALLVSKIRPHVNIVQFLGVCVNPLCVVYEFLPAGNLRSYLDNKENDIDDKLRLKWFAGVFHRHLLCSVFLKMLCFLTGIASGMLHLSFEKIVSSFF
jgi:hypothetical protein